MGVHKLGLHPVRGIGRRPLPREAIVKLLRQDAETAFTAYRVNVFGARMRGRSMSRSMVGLLAAVGATISGLAGYVHSDLPPVMITGAGTAAGVAAYLALPSSKNSWPPDVQAAVTATLRPTLPHLLAKCQVSLSEVSCDSRGRYIAGFGHAEPSDDRRYLAQPGSCLGCASRSLDVAGQTSQHVHRTRLRSPARGR
jgi:hypothetical protein